MKVLVTGGAGFIGSWTVDLLLERGYEVKILDSLERPVHLWGRPSYIPKEVELIEGDVRSRKDWLRALEGVEAVFHLAAYQDYLPDFSRFFHVNSVGTALLYELVLEHNLPVHKVVLGSSQAVYGEGKYECPHDGIVYPDIRSLEQLMEGDWEVKCPLCGGEITPQLTDESRVNPQNQYALSKYSQELIALNLGKRYGIATVVLRYSITQGPRQSFFNAYSGICRIFTLRLLAGQPPVIYEDGGQLRDYVYVGDVARANLLALEQEVADYQAFNVGGGRAYTVLEFAELLCSRFDGRFEPEVRGEFRFGDTRHIVSDISRIKSLGWQPETSLEQIVDEYIEWARSQPELIEDYYAQAERVMREKKVVRRSKVRRSKVASRRLERP